MESRAIATALAVSLAALAAFVVRELTARAPIVDLRLFLDGNYAIGVILNAAMTATLFAAIFLQPLFMEEVLGLTPMRTSLMLLPRSLALMVMMVVAGSLNERVSPRVMILAGAAVTTYAAIDMSHLTSQSGTYELVRSSILQGIGMALAFIPMETVSLSCANRLSPRQGRSWSESLSQCPSGRRSWWDLRCAGPNLRQHRAHGRGVAYGTGRSMGDRLSVLDDRALMSR